jgi:hypothetical protein
MAIFRGVGGAGTASDNAFLLEISEASEAAQAAAEQAEQSALAAVNAEVSSATFNTSDGVLTLTKTGGATVTADLDGRFLTSYTETNDLSTAVTWANVPDANITETSVTQHQGALSITESQISDLGTYLTASDITGKANLTGANFTGPVSITGGSLSIGTLLANQDVNVFGNITVSGTVDGVDIASLGNTVAGKADLTGDTFTGTITAPNVDISTTGTVTTNIATGTGGTSDTKTLNLGTGYGGSLVGLTTVNIGSQSTSCQNTVNIGSGVSTSNREDTINLKGNVTVDGTLNGAPYEKVKRTRFLKRGYLSTSIINVLTTSLSRVGDLLQTKSSDGSENELEFSMGLQYSNTYGTNDGVFYVTVTAPTPSDEDTVNLGTVTSATTLGSLYTIALSGDVTKYLSPYCGMSVNSDGSSAFGFNNNQGWYYYSSNNTTYITMYAYQGNKPTQGDTVYLHPFDWESSGTEILGTEYQFDRVVYNASLMFREYQNVYLGYFKSNLTVQVKAKEVTQAQGEDGTTISVRSIEGKITQTES